jgi:hypothetical protein
VDKDLLVFIYFFEPLLNLASNSCTVVSKGIHIYIQGRINEINKCYTLAAWSCGILSACRRGDSNLRS